MEMERVKDKVGKQREAVHTSSGLLKAILTGRSGHRDVGARFKVRSRCQLGSLKAMFIPGQSCGRQKSVLSTT